MRLDEVQDLKAIGTIAEENPGAEIFYSRHAVVVLTDRERFHAAHLILRPSPWMIALSNLERHKNGFTTDEFIVLVRTAFPNEFEGSQGTEWHLERILKGTAPPYLRFFVPTFDNVPLRDIKQTVQCSYNVADGLHYLIPNLGGMEEAMHAAETAIERKLNEMLVYGRARQALEPVDCTIVRGTPKLDNAFHLTDAGAGFTRLVQTHDAS